ncbi:MAG: ABC-F family ATP-binding cassette domain-containing protein [Candidatus Syntrophosphaera sp.]|jgi:ATP-binding cassette subfamily F protein 3|nr:ABC-F family ATP-binding cassette domain-containing protein [Candidatus Syntrophosphaera sp.]
MSLVRALDVSLEFGGNYILKNINCSVEHNSRIGLIGANGCGKSSLLKVLYGVQTPTSGKVERAKHCKIAYLPQEYHPLANRILLKYVRSSRPELLKLERDIEILSEEFKANPNKELEAELNKIIEQYTSLGGYDFDNEIKYVLTSLNFPPETWNYRCGEFSGGELTRIGLANVLLSRSDLIMLDEPTNHLDIEMIGWLEKYLNNQKTPFIVVSHDRQFLDNTVDTVWSLRDSNLTITKGNYSSYRKADEIAQLTQKRQYERQQKYILETEDFIQKNIAGSRSNLAKSRLKQIERMEIVKRPAKQKNIKLSIEANKRSGNDIYVLENVSYGIFPNKELAREVNLTVNYQDSICILGPNSCGKTTLLKILLQELEIFSGTLKVGASLDIGYYDQQKINLDPSLTVLDTIWQLIPDATIGYVRSWLARFGFYENDIDKKVELLSGGEKSRLYLCRLIHTQPNVLLLDEPTNHLDLQMSESLLDALKAYNGTIIFITHDRWFMKGLATKFWVFRKLKTENECYTTIQEYIGNREEAINLAFEKPKETKTPPPPRKRQKRVNPWHMHTRLIQIEESNREYELLKEELQNIHYELSQSSTYSSVEQVKLLQKNMKELEEQMIQKKELIEKMEEEYLELYYQYYDK